MHDGEGNKKKENPPPVSFNHVFIHPSLWHPPQRATSTNLVVTHLKPKTAGGKPIPQRQAESTVREYLRRMKPGQVRTGCEPSELWDFMMCVMQQAYWPRLMAGKGDKNRDKDKNKSKKDGRAWLDATNGLAETTTAALPPMWIIHGADDTIVGFYLLPLPPPLLEHCRALSLPSFV